MPYTNEERKWLIDNVNNYDYPTLTKLFNEHFAKNVKRNTMQCFCKRSLKASKVNQNHHPFTKEQISFLLENKYMAYKKLTEIFNKHFNETKTNDCIRHKMQRLNCFKRVSPKVLTPGQKEFIKLRRLQKKEFDFIAKEFIDYFNEYITEGRVKNECNRMKISLKVKWTEEDYDFLRNNCKTLPATQLQRELQNRHPNEKVTISSILHKARRLNIKLRNRGKIIDNYSTSSNVSFTDSQYKWLCDNLNNYETIYSLYKAMSDVFDLSEYEYKRFNLNVWNIAKRKGKRFKRLNRDKNKIGQLIELNKCIYIKVSNSEDTGFVGKNYMKNYRKLWSVVLENNGIKIDKGCICLHLDGDYKNNDISNLEVVKRGELAQIAKLNAFGNKEHIKTLLSVIRCKEMINQFSKE